MRILIFQASLGVAKTNRCRLFVMTSPVGPYYPTGFKPVSLLADPQYVRAFEGGCGRYKIGAYVLPSMCHTYKQQQTIAFSLLCINEDNS